jgi:hypothetical protein
MTTDVKEEESQDVSGFPKLDLDEACLEVIERWLETQRVTLWSRFFWIREPKGRKEAATWLYKNLTELAEYCQED